VTIGVRGEIDFLGHGHAFPTRVGTGLKSAE